METTGNEIFITTIARAAKPDEEATAFDYWLGKYTQMLKWNRFDKLLGKFLLSELSQSKTSIAICNSFVALDRHTGFYLKHHKIDGVDHMLLFHSNDRIKSLYDRRDKSFIVDALFEKVDEPVNEVHPGISIQNGDAQQQTSWMLAPQSRLPRQSCHLTINGGPSSASASQSQGRELSLEDFYERLRRAHESDDLETGLPSDVQHINLRPGLRPYQKRGIKWMLKRELQAEELPSYIVKLRLKFNRDQIFYFNKYTLELLRECPASEVIPSGGLLTDEVRNQN